MNAKINSLGVGEVSSPTRSARPREAREGGVRGVSWQDKYAFQILLIPGVCVLVMLGVVPLVHVLYISFHRWELTKPWLGRPFVGLANYTALLKSPEVWHSLKLTVGFTVVSVGLSLVLGLGLAILLDQRVRGQSIFRSIFLIPMTITPVVVGLAWRFMLDPTFGVLNYLLERVGISPQAWLTDPRLVFPTIVAVDVWEWTPLVTLVLLAGLQALPVTPYEAAQIDGASGWLIFRRITLPMLRPTLLIALLLRTMDAVRAFDTTYIMTGGGPGTATELASIHLYRKGLKYFHMGDASAYALLLLVAVIALGSSYVRLMSKEARNNGGSIC